ncbi:MAG: hypothetical protein AMXMBFR7_29200 [Planctomycetota bacterium]
MKPLIKETKHAYAQDQKAEDGGRRDGWLAWFAPEAHEQKAFLIVARGLYGLDASYGKCHLCHESKHGPSRQTLNDHGKALQGVEDK